MKLARLALTVLAALVLAFPLLAQEKAAEMRLDWERQCSRAVQ